MKFDFIPYDCLDCSGKPGEEGFDYKFCLKCSESVIEAYKRFIKQLSNVSLFEESK